MTVEEHNKLQHRKSEILHELFLDYDLKGKSYELEWNCEDLIKKSELTDVDEQDVIKAKVMLDIIRRSRYYIDKLSSMLSATELQMNNITELI